MSGLVLVGYLVSFFKMGIKVDEVSSSFNQITLDRFEIVIVTLNSS